MTELIIGGVTASTLAEKYKTPLYVYDEEKMRQTMLSFKRGFVSKRFDTKVLYASKAFQTIEMLHLVREYGFGLDVVSGGKSIPLCKLIFLEILSTSMVTTRRQRN